MLKRIFIMGILGKFFGSKNLIMKNNFLILLFILTNTFAYAQNIGIGTSTPNASAQLDVSSTNSGLLPPRMTYAQRNAILNPAAGLIVFCTNCNGGAGEMNYYNGNTWMNMTIGTASNIVANLPSVTIGTQVWTNQNLSVARYRNGDIIPEVKDAATWDSLTSGAWCWYNNDSTTYAATYGRLYNWFAVNDARGLAPQGWHVPDDAEWKKLVKYLDVGADTTDIYCTGCYQSTIAGGDMKSTTGWNAPNTGATNSSGFTGLPGGLRSYDGWFSPIGFVGFWWSSTEYNTSFAWGITVSFGNSNYLRSSLGKRLGFSVRCIRD
jgi:uncharacterized protein (TIGR02145 family)